MSIQQNLKFPFGALGSQAISSIGHQAIPSKGHIDFFTVLKNKHLSYTAEKTTGKGIGQQRIYAYLIIFEIQQAMDEAMVDEELRAQSGDLKGPCVKY